MEKGITKISVAGFKSIANKTTLDIKPLTLLAGANSSGKSSFMQPLLLLKQTLEAPYDPGPLLLNGANVKFTSFDQMLTSTKNRNLKKEFSINLHSGSRDVTLFFSRKAKQISLSCMKSSDPATRVDSDMKTSELVDAMRAIFGNEPSLGLEKIGKTLGWEAVRQYCFLSVMDGSRKATMEVSGRDFFSKIIGNIIHVAGIRRLPERTYPATGITMVYPGLFENYTANVIATWEENESAVLEQLCLNLSRLGLTSKISAKRLNDAEIQVMVGRLLRNGQGKSDMVSIADVGVGVSQSLPVLVALLAAEAGQLVYLEEPEIHLHPRAQRALAEILVEAANRSVKVVVETHSSMLLLAIQTLIAKQKISPDNVALHWFQRNKAGMTDVETAKLSKEGTFGEWPVDFGEVELEAEGEFIDAVATARRGRK